MADLIYKICDAGLWEAAKAAGRFDGAAIDLTDGYIHFSTAGQVRETAEKHFSGLENLLLIAVPTEPLGKALKWEPSRGGALFPHLYGPLDPNLAAWVEPLEANGGSFVFPDEIP